MRAQVADEQKGANAVISMSERENLRGDGGMYVLPIPVEDTKGAILRESLVLFAERGYGATTVRDIAQRVGILSGSLYSHFPSKEDILAQLVELGMREHNDRLVSALRTADPDPQAQLVALTRTHVLFHAQFATLATVLHAEMHILSAEKVATTRQLRDQSSELFRDVIRRGVAAGEFDVTDLEVAAVAIVSMGVRVAFWYTPSFHLGVDALSEQMGELARRIVGVSS